MCGQNAKVDLVGAIAQVGRGVNLHGQNTGDVLEGINQRLIVAVDDIVGHQSWEGAQRRRELCNIANVAEADSIIVGDDNQRAEVDDGGQVRQTSVGNLVVEHQVELGRALQARALLHNLAAKLAQRDQRVSCVGIVVRP